MWGHFKAEEFMNAIEGTGLSKNRGAHLQSCSACSQRLQAIRAIRNAVAVEDATIPEPDWHEFRESVREGLLSRSVKRESVVRRWTGWPIRPAMAWGVSFALLICISAGGFLWHFANHDTQEEQPVAAAPSSPSSGDTVDMEAEVAAWGHAGLFESLASIPGGQAEHLRKLLADAAQEEKVERQ